MGKITTFAWRCFTLQVKPDFVLFIVHLTSRRGRTSATAGLSAPLSNLLTACHLLPTDVAMELELPLTSARLFGQIHRMQMSSSRVCTTKKSGCDSLFLYICLCVRDSISAQSCTCCSTDSSLAGICRRSVNSFPDNEYLFPKLYHAMKPYRPVKIEISLDGFSGIKQNRILRMTPLTNNIADFLPIIHGLYLRHVSVE